jgi:ABC-type multidrug transport system fused ATPase/permease subunit
VAPAPTSLRRDLVFENGHLVDARTRESLMTGSRLYRRLVAGQGGAALVARS